MYELRKNQIEPVRLGTEFFMKKKTVPSLLIAPVGFGKAIVQAYIAKNIQSLGKVIILQPSKELLMQNYEKFKSIGGEASIYSASMNKKEYGHVTYATIGSIKNIGHLFNEMNYKFMIIDEADRFSRESSGMLRTFIKNSKIEHILGLTATPFKLQQIATLSGNESKLTMLTTRNKYGTFFKDIIHVTQIQDIVKEGFWSKLVFEVHKFDKSELRYNSSRAEYTDESIELAYEHQNLKEKIITRVNELRNIRKSILIFVPSVAEAKALSESIKDSYVVWGNMPDAERNYVITNFKLGLIQIVINVNVLSVGFDHPSLDCIIQARPTASLSIYYQQQGRGVRLHPDKENCLIIDFVGNIEKFGTITDLVFRKAENWQMYSKDILLTGIPISQIGSHTVHTINKQIQEKNELKQQIENLKNYNIITFGKYAGKRVDETPAHWRDWMLENFKFDSTNMYIKNEILRLCQKNKS